MRIRKRNLTENQDLVILFVGWIQRSETQSII